jgi:hypothetical protein
MRKILHEKTLVIVLFVMVVITFAFAQRDTKKIEAFYNISNSEITNSDIQKASPDNSADIASSSPKLITTFKPID